MRIGQQDKFLHSDHLLPSESHKPVFAENTAKSDGIRNYCLALPTKYKLQKKFVAKNIR